MSQSTRVRHVVSLIDTAPTVVDLLGLPPPPPYEGHSMLDGENRLALFFTDYSLPLVGLRDGARKIIHDLRSGRSRWFDLDRDPDETTDVSNRNPAETKRYKELLEGWIASRR
jgi:arylsulfatase A-like enzyme